MARKPLILCLDDEWNELEGRKELLEQRGCQVLVTTSVWEGLRWFDQHAVDLVLLDYHMPEMMGDLLAREMKARKSDVPIAMLSSDNDVTDDVLKSVDAFVSKSESLANFLQIVEQLLNLRLLFAPLDLDGDQPPEEHAA